MKREEIEQLLAEYTSGEISPENKQYLEKLFEQDAKLKREADEMARAWQSLNGIEDGEQPPVEIDRQFYAMLQAVKSDRKPVGRVVPLNLSWLKAIAAAAACIAIFVAGRFSIAPVEIIKYKTVMVKQPAEVEPQTKKQEPVLAIAHPAKHQATKQKQENKSDNSALAQQLRSVFASERIDAVVKLSAQKDLNESDLKLLELALTEDPNPNVRLMVINSLRPVVNKQNVQQVLISGLNHQEDLLVQSSLVDLLIAAKSKLAIPQMITLMDNKKTDAIVQNKIKGGIESFLN